PPGLGESRDRTRGGGGAARAAPPRSRDDRRCRSGRRDQRRFRPRAARFLAVACRRRALAAAALHLLSTDLTPFLNWASRARVSGLCGVAAKMMYVRPCFWP